MSPQSSSAAPTHPLRPIPGEYGLPIIGALLDRFDFFYLQGQDLFFRSRMEKNNSTVFRANMPPGPGLLTSDHKVVVLLDAASFPILFDTSKVEKRNVLDGTFMPSTLFTGGYRACAFLDPSEPNHRLLKTLFLSFLSSRTDHFLPLFRSKASSMFASLESQLASSRGNVEWGPLNDAMSFDFVYSLFTDCHVDAYKKGPTQFNKWLLCQLAPLATLSPPKICIPIEDLILHCFGLPSCLVKSDYQSLYDAFWSTATSFLDEAEKAGMARDEACHNLVFLAGFNAFGGMKAWFPAMIKWVGGAGEALHRSLREEIRAVVRDEGGEVTLKCVDRMSLTKSVVYEALRMEPPVPLQYGRVKEDTVVRSHDASFRVKKGEMLCGYQPLAMRDPKVFEKAEEFVGDRFVGEEGERLIKYVYWSNGRETDDPTAENKQCPGKDLVLLMSRVLLVELFLRYDSFEVESGKLLLASTVTFVSLTKASTSPVV